MNINKYLLVSLVCLLIAVAYLVGILQTKSPQPQVESSKVTVPTASPTPIVTTRPVVTKTATLTPQPTNSPERKKVSIYIDDNGGFTKGTFYCYEDKVNELAQIQNDIRNYDNIGSACWSREQPKLFACYEGCRTQTNSIECDKNCNSEVEKICGTKSGDLRKELYNKVREYCP